METTSLEDVISEFYQIFIHQEQVSSRLQFNK